jgi:hypothetical protein
MGLGCVVNTPQSAGKHGSPKHSPQHPVVRTITTPTCRSSDDEPPPASSQQPPWRHPEMDDDDVSLAPAGSGGGGSGSNRKRGSSLVPDALPVMGADTDWREFRARLVASSHSSSAARGDGRGATAGNADPSSGADARGRGQRLVDDEDLGGDSGPGTRTAADNEGGEEGVGWRRQTVGMAWEADGVEGGSDEDTGGRLPGPAYRGLTPVWAHALPRPERGCLLLAHPMMFHSSQEYFYQAVILLLGWCGPGCAVFKTDTWVLMGVWGRWVTCVWLRAVFGRRRGQSTSLDSRHPAWDVVTCGALDVWSW